MRNNKLRFVGVLAGVLVAGVSVQAFAEAPKVTAIRSDTYMPPAAASGSALATSGTPQSGSNRVVKLSSHQIVVKHVVHLDGTVTSSVLADTVPSGTGVNDVAAGEKLVYGNSLGDFLIRAGQSTPGISFPVADDLGSDALMSCDLVRYRAVVNGGITGGGGTFFAIVSLFDECPAPAGAGSQIAGTRVVLFGLDNDINVTHVIEVVIDPSNPIPVVGTLWLRLQFSSGEAGGVGGQPPVVGFSADTYGTAFSCESSFGGFPNAPHASLNASLISNDTCSVAFLSYQAVKQASVGFSGGTDRRYADDITMALGDSFCELAVLEMGIVGSTGPYDLDVDFRQLGDLSPLQGTAQTASGKGLGSLEIFRFEYPPNVFLPNQDLFVTWKVNKARTGPVIVGRTQAGFSAPTFSEIGANNWIGPNILPPPDNMTPAIFWVRVKCRGEAPRGACCPTQTPNLPDVACTIDADCPLGRVCQAGACSPIECSDDVTVTSCLSGRWEANVTCAANTFNPPCGTHACCKPDNSCNDEFFDDCILVTDPDSPIETCVVDSDCAGGNRICMPTLGVCQDNSPCTPGGAPCGDNSTCQNICSPRTAQWRPGEFCGVNFQQCPIFECFFGVGNCFDSQAEIVCNSDADCPFRERCEPFPFSVCEQPRGCSQLFCCDQVCRTPGFDFCCSAFWDFSCANVAQTVCGDLVTAANNDCFNLRCNDIPFACEDATFCIGKGYGDACVVNPNLGAVPITLDSNNQGTESAFTQSAASSIPEPAFCCSKNGPADKGAGTVWFQVVVPAGETSGRFNTCLTPGSPTSRDSILQVYRVGNPAAGDLKQECESLEVLGCNDDYGTCGGGGGNSDLCVDGLIPGETIFIELAGSNADSQGTYRLDVAFPCPRLQPGSPDAPPVNDTCDGAQGTPNGQAAFSVPFDVSNSSVDCPRPTDPECTALINDVWFIYFAPCTGVAHIETCGATPSDPDPTTTVAAYRSLDLFNACPPDVFLGCNDDAPVDAFEHQRRSQTCMMGGQECDDDASCGMRCQMGGNVCVDDTDCVDAADTCKQDPCISSCGSGSALTIPVIASGQYRIELGGEFGSEPTGMLSVECVPQDCQPNGFSDLQDILGGQSADCDANRVPDECDIANCPAGDPACGDCNGNGVPDVCDLANATLTDTTPADGIPDECATCPDGSVMFVTPADGTLDARQPHPIGDSTMAQGFSTFVVTAPMGADDVSCWSLCETSARNFSPNGIASVVDNGNGTMTVSLSRGITGGEVTRIAYTSGSGTVTIGTFLSNPGNVNGDSATTVSDITALVDALNGVSPRPIYRTDMNRSGVFNPSDLTRLIDLLNGANAFTPWLSAPKPTGTCTP